MMIGVFANLLLAPKIESNWDDLNKFRLAREQSLKSKFGWLSVDGLIWVEEGENTIGSDKSNKLVLPEGSPLRIGTLVKRLSKFTLNTAQGVEVKKGETAFANPISTDESQPADKITVGTITFSVIKRGERFALRVWNPDSEAQRNFKGLAWFSPKESLIVQAKYTPHSPPKTLPIVNVLGDTTMVSNPGVVEFELNGKKHRLEAEDGDGSLFFNFKDKTNGKDTYSAGRFLTTKLPKDGLVTLDFNYATNPPCAYTKFATCPLPPKVNYLSVSIEAGEKYLHKE